MEREEFYNKVSEILNIAHEYHEPYKRRTRWNTRRLGNGRFPGYGLVQDFGGTVRIMRQGHPTVWLKSYEEAFEYLSK